MTASDTRWCEMATGPRLTFFLSAGYIRESYGLNGPPAGVLRLHRRAIPAAYSDKILEHVQNMSAGKSDLCAHLHPCEILTGACFLWGTVGCINHPRNLPARLARKGMTGDLDNFLPKLLGSGTLYVLVRNVSMRGFSFDQSSKLCNINA